MRHANGGWTLHIYILRLELKFKEESGMVVATAGDMESLKITRSPMKQSFADG